MSKLSQNNQFRLVAIFMSFFLPIIAAYSLYYLGYGHHYNRSYGTLIRAKLSTPFHHKWHIVSLNIAPEDPRIITLQKRQQALGKDQHRVGMIQTHTHSIQKNNPIKQKKSYLQDLKALKTDDTFACFWFIVDPQGRPVLCYPQDIEPKKIDLDLRKLLKNARIG